MVADASTLVARRRRCRGQGQSSASARNCSRNKVGVRNLRVHALNTLPPTLAVRVAFHDRALRHGLSGFGDRVSATPELFGNVSAYGHVRAVRRPHRKRTSASALGTNVASSTYSVVV